MGLSDRVGWLKFGEAMVNYKYAHNLIKVVPAYGFAFGVFLLGNTGTRFLGLLRIKKQIMKWKSLKGVEVFMGAVAGAGIMMPTLFLQKGTPWNTIQFFYYSLFFLGIWAGVAVSRLKREVGIVIIFLTLPTTFLTLKDIYLTKRPPAFLPTEERQALNFLKNEPDGVVLTYPFDEIKALAANEHPPRPLYLYVSTAYVSAYGEKPVFLEDEMNLTITGFDFTKRRMAVDEFLKTQDSEVARKFLKDNNIKYIYWLKNKSLEINQRATLGETQLGIERIYENEMVDIYSVL